MAGADRHRSGRTGPGAGAYAVHQRDPGGMGILDPSAARRAAAGCHRGHRSRHPCHPGLPAAARLGHPHLPRCLTLAVDRRGRRAGPGILDPDAPGGARHRHAGDLGHDALRLAGRSGRLVPGLRRPLCPVGPRRRSAPSPGDGCRPLLVPGERDQLPVLGRRGCGLSESVRRGPRVRAEGPVGPLLSGRPRGAGGHRPAGALRHRRAADRGPACRLDRSPAVRGAWLARRPVPGLRSDRGPHLAADRRVRGRAGRGRRQLLLEQPMDPWRPAHRRRSCAAPPPVRSACRGRGAL